MISPADPAALSAPAVVSGAAEPELGVVAPVAPVMTAVAALVVVAAAVVVGPPVLAFELFELPHAAKNAVTAAAPPIRARKILRLLNIGMLFPFQLSAVRVLRERIVVHSVNGVVQLARLRLMSTSPAVWSPEPGEGRVVMVVVAHADDVALFIGGTVARWTAAGWRVIEVRVTDDRWDSLGLDEAETIRRNAAEVRLAAGVLGIAEVIDLGWPTDTLADISETALRKQIIRLIRTHRPYALVTFDPYSMYGEDNQDHKVVAAAVDESFWTSQFDKHHPEHLAAGLEPHGVFERWYFGRRVIDVTHVVDTASTLATKIDAALCHQTPLRNFVNQLRLQARTGGWRVPMLDAAQATDSIEQLRNVMKLFITSGAARTGGAYGLGAAEEFRMVRFGGLEALLDESGERL